MILYNFLYLRFCLKFLYKIIVDYNDYNQTSNFRKSRNICGTLILWDNRGWSRNFANSVLWGCIGRQERGFCSRISRTTQSSNSAMQSQRMRAFVSPYSHSPSSSPGRALRSDQASFRFRLSVSARFVSRASRSPYPEDDAGRAEDTEDDLEERSFAGNFPHHDAVHLASSLP